MIRSRYVTLCSAAVLASMTLQSCAVHRTLTSAEVVTSPADAPQYTRFAHENGQPVTGYVTRDGRQHLFEGRARLEGDTLVFWSEDRHHSRMAKPEPPQLERVALADLQSVRSEAIDPLRSILLAGGLVVVAGMILVGGMMVSESTAWFPAF